jgi:hypothetical protein
VIDTLDFDQKQTLLRLIVEDVHVTGWHVQIRLRIPLNDGPDGQSRPPGPTPDPDDPGPMSTQDPFAFPWYPTEAPGARSRQARPGCRRPSTYGRYAVERANP